MHMPCSAYSKVTFILIQNAVSKAKRNKFKIEGSIGSWLARNFWMSLRFTTELFDLITTNLSHVLRKSLLKDVQTRRYIDEGVRN
jgi:hypothetical protein